MAKFRISSAIYIIWVSFGLFRSPVAARGLCRWIVVVCCRKGGNAAARDCSVSGSVAVDAVRGAKHDHGRFPAALGGGGLSHDFAHLHFALRLRTARGMRSHRARSASTPRHETSLAATERAAVAIHGKVEYAARGLTRLPGGQTPRPLCLHC